MTEALLWGQADLLHGSADLPYVLEASGDGTTWGNPEAVITALQSRLQDGSIGSIDSFENRQAQIHVRVRADTSDGLAAGEAALVAETQLDGYNTLSWTPPASGAATSVFDVVYATLEHEFSDLSELRLERSYVATLWCLPFPRSDTELTAAAVPTAAPVITSIDACTSNTGWAGSPTNPPTAGGTTLVESATAAGFIFMSMTRTGTVSLTGTPYVFVDWRRNTFGPDDSRPVSALVLFYDDGAGNSGNLPSVATFASPTAGYTRTYFQIPTTVTSVTTLGVSILFGSTTSGSPALAFLEIDQVSKATALPTIGTRRQLVRSLPVAGTVRTQGRLSIEHETSSLGEVLAYCYQDGGAGSVPALRSYYFSGGTVTTDANLVSGASNMLDTAVEYRIPVANLVAGNHRLYARVKGDSAGAVTLNIAAYTRVGSTDVPGTLTFSVTLDVATTYAIVDLGALSLPPTLLPAGSGATVRLTIVDASTAGIDVTLDEAWVFNLDIGTLNHIDCGSAAPAAGGSAKRLWFDPATVTNDGFDAIFCGHSADRSDAFHPGPWIKGWTPPIFEPPSMNVFTVTTNALDAAVELRHYPRFLHNVAQVI